MAVIAAALLVCAVSAYFFLRASLPPLDGERHVAGLSGQVALERDSAGIPTVTATTREDLAFGLGVVHAQDRFFQMDLMRRKAAGELSALVGGAALPLDKRSRLHRFRHRAALGVVELREHERSVLDAYVAGVNEGLGSLSARPFEYAVLRTAPEPWVAEDTLLVVYAMYMELNDQRAARDLQRVAAHRVLPPAVFDWLYPAGTSWDSALTGDSLPPMPLPGAETFNLRERDLAAFGGPVVDREGLAIGSNNWAVAGTVTRSGRAIVANDMHLGITVPNIFYRAMLSQTAGETRRVSGVTLPGAPVVVAGSTEHIAWGFTNSYGDWSDAVVLVPGDEPGSYRTPDGVRTIEVHLETIDVLRGDAETFPVRETVWGPIVEDAEYPGGDVAVSWVAHAPGAVTIAQLELETAKNIDEAINIATRLAMPAQNFVTGDSTGRIGWALAGRIPARGNADPGLPADWSRGDGWQGWLPAADNPRIVDPPSGRLWTANTRVVSGSALRKIGDGGYYVGARGAQIRDALLAGSDFVASDMLAIHLDDRALFLARWRRLLLDLLDDAATDGRPQREEYRRLVRDWLPRASRDSVGYRLVRAFRREVREKTFRMLVAPVREVSGDDVTLRMSNQFEAPLWQLVSEQPLHLLDASYADWPAFLLSALDDVIADFDERYTGTLADRRWGEVNTAAVRHPLSAAVPLLSGWLDMPAVPLDGDTDMPRVQRPAFGASERFAVSPGDEQSGYLHIPAGQSGHPLSPNYRTGHDDWVQGNPSPFLPGPAAHRLILTPAD